jgi:hypothetical protein
MQKEYAVWKYFDTYPEYKIKDNLTYDEAKSLRSQRNSVERSPSVTYEIRKSTINQTSPQE